MNENYISLESIRNFVKGYNDELTQEQAYKHLTNIKTYLLARCRKGSKAYNAIYNITLENLAEKESHWNYNRIVSYKFDDGFKGRYIPGQDEQAELNEVKKHIIKNFR